MKELFRPFIAAQMVNNSYGKVTNIKSALKLLDKHRDGILEAQRGKIKTISDAVSDALNDLEKHLWYWSQLQVPLLLHLIFV